MVNYLIYKTSQKRHENVYNFKLLSIKYVSIRIGITLYYILGIY